MYFMKMSMHIEEWELIQPFRIAGAEWINSRGIVVQLAEDGCLGRGEAQGVFYLDETAESIFDQVDEVAREIRRGISRDDLQQFTIGLEATAEAMAAKAAAAADAPVLKIKLDGHQPYEKLAAIRAARPDATLVVDANQGWDYELLQEVIPKCAGLGLAMIEQPLARGGDDMLQGFESPITLAADESCLHSGELEYAAGRYDMINIKLDKTGGLTEALHLARAARSRGCQLMVGNMVGTSLGMAPSFVVAQLCDFVDIDGPLLLKYDHPQGLEYRNGVVSVFDSRFWG
jgi:L-alanine-DL-glutamate epimerase-like enolase superfamily enzyme